MPLSISKISEMVLRPSPLGELPKALLYRMIVAIGVLTLSTQLCLGLMLGSHMPDGVFLSIYSPMYLVLSISGYFTYKDSSYLATFTLISGMLFVLNMAVFGFVGLKSYIYISLANTILMSGLLLGVPAAVATLFASITTIIAYTQLRESLILPEYALVGDTWDYTSIPNIACLGFSALSIAYCTSRASTLVAENQERNQENERALQALSHTTELNSLRAREGVFMTKLTHLILNAGDVDALLRTFSEQVRMSLDAALISFFTLGENAWVLLGDSSADPSKLVSSKRVPLNPSDDRDEKGPQTSPVAGDKTPQSSDSFYRTFDSHSPYSGQIHTSESEQNMESPFLVLVVYRDVPNKKRNSDAFLSIVTKMLRRAIERLNIEEQLRQTQKMEAIGLLARGVAHEFNNLLSNICGNTELALLRTQDKPKVRTRLQQVERATAQAASLTHQLLTFTQHPVQRPQAVSVNQVIQNTATLIRSSAGKSLTWKFELSDVDPHIMIDQKKLESALLNLLLNSCEATQDGKGYIQIRSFVQGEKDTPNKTLLIEIRDNGSGMTAEVKSHLFTPFFTTKSMREGTGLGLTSVLRIVQQAKGKIDVQSIENEGTLFTLSFPLTPVSEHLPAQDMTKNEFSERGDQEVVLVVEDDPEVRLVIVEMLAVGNYQTVETRDVCQAKELLSMRDDIALILSDAIMPGEHGIELYKYLREQKLSIPFILITGFTHDKVSEYPIPILEKPVSIKELLCQVKKSLHDSTTP